MNAFAQRFIAGWNHFWHTPAEPHMAAFFRIAVGLIVALAFLGQYPFVELWWGDDGVCPPEIGQRMRAPTSWSLLFWLGSEWLWVAWGLAITHALLLAAGVFHRINAAFLFVWLVSFQNRCGVLNDGEDLVMRFFVFFLIFLDASRVWAVTRRRDDAPTHSGFAMRLIQIQTVFVFGVAGMEKWPGKAWWNGDAMYWVVHLDDYAGRLPYLPELLQSFPWLSWPMSTGTLFFEAIVPVMVWFRRTRWLGVGIAIFFHLALEAMSHLYAFEWLMIAGWLTFLRWSAEEPY